MGKKIKKMLCIMMAAVMCLSITGVALAGTGVTSQDAGAYGTIGGSLSSSSGYVRASTYVTKNTDGATLYLKVDINSQTSTLTHQDYSVTGQTNIPLKSIAIVELADEPAVRAFSTNEVRGNSGSYAAYGYASIG